MLESKGPARTGPRPLDATTLPVRTLSPTQPIHHEDPEECPPRSPAAAAAPRSVPAPDPPATDGPAAARLAPAAPPDPRRSLARSLAGPA